ncbi:MAG: N-6 DNA methylase [Clostridiales bacterium]|nr:N-6 DNA methylase [Clostridiales bacterium]
MTENEQKAAAKAFAVQWAGHGDEKQETQAFWLTLLQTVYGLDNPAQHIQFELPVKLSHTSFIDAYLPDTRVLIEQKGMDINLRKGYKQSDGSLLTPYGQARRYAGYLPHDQNPRWIVVCNFQTFEIHDMNKPNDEPEVLRLADLPKEPHRLNFLVDTGNEDIRHEMEVSMAAGEIVGLLYDAFAKQYRDPASPKAMHSLNVLCVRLVFCLYAEDAGIFGRHGMFHDYLAESDTRQMRRALLELFRVLDTPAEERDEYLQEDNPTLAAFPYVNGGLFSDEDIEVPPFTDEIRDLLLNKASSGFDWSEISPTIFGAVFESTLNPETRRSGGMHYTSIENIHKVIDPLFLDDLKREFGEICAIPVARTKERKLREFQKKLASASYLDPACGSGNFLTESYLSLRRLENEVLRALNQEQISFGDVNHNPIQVSLSQFYGIEINDFAVTVAKTALWIAESQMMKETEEIVLMHLPFLPLKSYTNIVEGNALRLNWEDVVPKGKLSYIMGNPPFVGTNWMTDEQRKDMDSIWGDKRGKLDYVSCWYVKASDFMLENRNVRCAFVSTNSICQGEQATSLWRKILLEKKMWIQFAVQSFIWNSQSTDQANVHVVIVGFGASNIEKKKLYHENTVKYVENINGYLLPAPTVIIEERAKPLCDVPAIMRGSQATDDGNYLFTLEEKTAFLAVEPQSEKYFKRFMMGREFINNIERWCLWLPNATPDELKQCPKVREQIKKVRDFRSTSKNAQTRKAAEFPQRFGQYRPPTEHYIAFAKVSSGRRRYIPMGFLTDDIIPGDKLFTIPNATLYQFGILMSNVHNAWMRAVCGRLKSDYSYSTTIVYNNFPWPTPTDAQKEKIEQTAQAILDARKLYPNSSLADMYGDEMYLYPELRRAHQQNDRAVMQAYGFPNKGVTESICVAELMRRYQALLSQPENR